MARSTSWEDAAAGSIVGAIVVVAVVLLVFSIWLVVRLLQLMLQGVVAHYTNRAFLGTLGVCSVLCAVTVATHGQYEPLDIMTGISAVLVLGVIGVLDIADDTRFRRPMSRGTAVHSVLHEWWPAA
jgi:hypothetical protein